MTTDEREQIIRHYHSAYVAFKKPMIEIEEETGLSSRRIREAWKRLGLPNLTALAKRRPPTMRTHPYLFSKSTSADFQHIAVHEAVWLSQADSTCVVCSEVHP